MCIYGFLTKKEIKEAKKNHPENFIETFEALKLENNDIGLFALGLLAHYLEFLGVETAIEIKEYSKNQKDELKYLQFIFNGMISRKKYILHFDMGKKRNDELLYNEKEYEKFKENLKKKLSKDYNIPVDKIIVTLPQKESLHVQVIFESQDFDYLDKAKFKNDKEFKELQNLKDIQEDVIMGAMKLNKNLLDPRGNRCDWDWGYQYMKGGVYYDPPLGWIGIGLNVTNKYDRGDNAWLAFDTPGAWDIAYYCAGSAQSNDELKKYAHLIRKSSFETRQRNKHEDCFDLNHLENKVGNGVYCTPYIKTAEDYCYETEINYVKYKLLFMVRVNPKSIRFCYHLHENGLWVVNGTDDEIRPYRILYKKK